MTSNHEVLVSIIVPVYNTKDYLVRCLDSLKAQTIASIEFIIVDDGSTDGSESICDSFTSQDSRFIVIHQSNSGQASARNRALSEANGKYVMFVDSDDWVADDFCETAVTQAESHNADIVVFRYNRVLPNGEVIIEGPSDAAWGLHSNLKALEMIDECTGYVWNKIYSLEKCFSQLRFPIGFYYEDQGTTHRAIYNAERVFISNEVLYNYVYRDNSTVTIASKRIENDRFVMDMLQTSDFEEWGLRSLAKKKREFTAYRYLSHLGRRSKYSIEAMDILDNYDGNNNYFTTKNKVMLRLYQCSKSLFDLLCIISGKRYRV